MYSLDTGVIVIVAEKLFGSELINSQGEVASLPNTPKLSMGIKSPSSFKAIPNSVKRVPCPFKT
jgi:hypothetical protein